MDNPREFLDYLSKRSGFEMSSSLYSGEEDYVASLKGELIDLITQLIHLAKTTADHKEKARYIDSLNSLTKLYLQVSGGDGSSKEPSRHSSLRGVDRITIDSVIDKVRDRISRSTEDQQIMEELDETIFEELDEQERNSN